MRARLHPRQLSPEHLKLTAGAINAKVIEIWRPGSCRAFGPQHGVVYTECTSSLKRKTLAGLCASLQYRLVTEG